MQTHGRHNNLQPTNHALVAIIRALPSDQERKTCWPRICAFETDEAEIPEWRPVASQETD
jgi:hypothetical protein